MTTSPCQQSLTRPSRAGKVAATIRPAAIVVILASLSALNLAGCGVRGPLFVAPKPTAAPTPPNQAEPARVAPGPASSATTPIKP